MSEKLEQIQELIDNLDDTKSGDDIIDSRDILNLKCQLEEIQEIYGELSKEDREQPMAEIDECLELLSELEEMEYLITDWLYGATLIHESYFTEYVKELANDCGYISNDFPDWIEIDWDSTAENVKGDYCEFEYDSHTYYAFV